MKRAYILPAAILSLSLVFGTVYAAEPEQNDYVYSEDVQKDSEDYQNENDNETEAVYIRYTRTETPEITVVNPKDSYSINETVTLVMTASEEFEIYYTLNGEDPLIEGQGILYEEEVEIPAPGKEIKIVLRAIAVTYEKEESGGTEIIEDEIPEEIENDLEEIIEDENDGNPDENEDEEIIDSDSEETENKDDERDEDLNSEEEDEEDNSKNEEEDSDIHNQDQETEPEDNNDNLNENQLKERSS